MISPISLVYVRLVSGFLDHNVPHKEPSAHPLAAKKPKRKNIYNIYILQLNASSQRCVCRVNSAAKCQQPTVCLRLQFSSWMPAANRVSAASIQQLNASSQRCVCGFNSPAECQQPTVCLRLQFSSWMPAANGVSAASIRVTDATCSSGGYKYRVDMCIWPRHIKCDVYSVHEHINGHKKCDV